jgi:tape measure domain-containing protein
MSDEATFAVRLIDKMTAPARAIRKSVAGISGAIKRVAAKPFARVADAVENGAARVKKAAKKKNIFDKMTSGIDTLRGKLWEMGKGAALVGGAMAAVAAVSFVQQSVSMAMFAETSRLAFKNLTGSTAGFERAKKLAAELGLNVVDTTKSMLKLLAAQFKMGESEDILKLAADMQAIGTSAENVQSIVYAISQIKSKGRLQGEELTQQLAEANVSTMLVYQALAAEMGKSVDAVRKAISAGQVDADMGIRAIKTAIMKKVGEHAPGEAAKQFADTTLTGLMQRLKNAPDNLFLRIAEQGKSAIPLIKKVVKQIDAAIASISPRGASEFVLSMLKLLEQAVPLVIEFGKGFAEGFSGITEALGMTGDLEANKKTWKEFGKTVADAIRLSIQALKIFGSVVMSVMEFAVSPIGKFVIAASLVGLTVFRVVAALGTLGTAFGMVTGSWGAIGVGATMLGTAFTAVGGAIATAGAAVLAFVGWPILIGIAVVTAIGAIWYFWDEIVDFGKKLGNWITGNGWQAGAAVKATSAASSLSVGQPTASIATSRAASPTAELEKKLQEYKLSLGATTTPTLQPGALAQAVMPGGGGGAGGVNVTISSLVVQSASGRPQDIADAIEAGLKRGLAQAATRGAMAGV